MDYRLSSDQEALLNGLGRLLQQRAGIERAMELRVTSSYDHVLHAALFEAGFFEVATGPETGSLEAALVLDAITRAAGTVAAGAATLVAPIVLGEPLDGPVALARQVGPELLRYAPDAATVLVLDGDDAVALLLEPGEVSPVRSSFGVPVGRVPESAWKRGRRLRSGSGVEMARWWRVALAIELSASASAALDITVGYVNERQQFGHPIGAFQAVQHRLAECAVLVEGARWLALEAAAHGAPAEVAATACAHAAAAAQHVTAETHQLSGAIGFTKEHPLQLFTMRAMGMTLELGGPEAHCREVAQQRWGR